MASKWLFVLFGGVFIGFGSVLFLAIYGWIVGISGIVGGFVERAASDRVWWLAFLVGFAVVGIVAAVVMFGAIGVLVRSLGAMAIVGLFVGFGARLGDGCTSGYGVCGLSRGSVWSLVAVATFMVIGVITAIVVGRLS